MPSSTFLASALILPAVALAQNTIRPSASLHYCVQSQYGSMVEGAPLVLAGCSGGAQQAFTHETETGLLSVFSNLCVSLTDDYQPGEQFTLQPCNKEDPNQVFEASPEQMKISNAAHNACFALGGDIAPGTALVGQDCVDGSAEQQFLQGDSAGAPAPAPEPAPGPAPAPSTPGAWYVSQDIPWICLTASAETEGADVVTADCDLNTSPAQRFEYDHDAQTISVFGGSLCLDATNDTVTLSACDSSAASQKFGSSLNNHVASMGSEKRCISVDGSIHGGPILLLECNPTYSSQMWISPKTLPTPPPHSYESILDPTKCIGAAAQEAGAAVVTVDCSLTDATQTTVYDRDVKAIKIGDLCWAAVDDAVQLAECDGSAEQQFASALNNRVAVASDKRVITLSSGAAGAPVILTELSLTSLSQVWVTKPSEE